MKKMTTMMVLTLGLFTLLLLAQPTIAGDACCPAEGKAAGSAAGTGTAAVLPVADETTPALPEGHPPVGGGGMGGGMSGGLPEGHPPMSGGMGGMGGGLPQGHPPIGGTSGGGEATADMRPAIGTVIVKVVQGTVGGPAIGADDVTIELYRGNKVIQQLKARLDENGALMTDGLKFAGVVQPIVTVTHGGVEYRAIGQPMSPTQPDQIVRVPVYEVTEEPVAWTIQMRHVMLHSSPHGLRVMEVLSVENPTDKTWRSPPEVSPEASPAPVQDDAAKADDVHTASGPTVMFKLPAGATNVQLGDGFHECCTKVEDGRIIHAMPLQPGSTKFRFSYIVPPTEGASVLDLVSGVPMARLSVFVPDDGSQIEAVGLQENEPMQAGDQKVRLFLAQDLAADAAVSLKIGPAHLKTSTPVEGAPGAGAAAPPKAPPVAKAVAGVGAVALLVAAGVVMFRPRKISG